jgi:hypothetical protein
MSLDNNSSDLRHFASAYWRPIVKQYERAVNGPNDPFARYSVACVLEALLWIRMGVEYGYFPAADADALFHDLDSEIPRIRRVINEDRRGFDSRFDIGMLALANGYLEAGDSTLRPDPQLSYEPIHGCLQSVMMLSSRFELLPAAQMLFFAFSFGRALPGTLGILDVGIDAIRLSAEATDEFDGVLTPEGICAGAFQFIEYLVGMKELYENARTDSAPDFEEATRVLERVVGRLQSWRLDLHRAATRTEFKYVVVFAHRIARANVWSQELMSDEELERELDLLIDYWAGISGNYKLATAY